MSDLDTAPLAKSHATVHGKRMAYHERGSGDALVFLHGNPTSSYLWRNVVPHVEDLGRVIVPDLIGHGDSDKLDETGPGSYRFVEHRHYLDGLLEQLDLDGPVVLHNGVLIKDARSGETTADLFLPPDLFAPAMEIMRGDAPPLVYVDQFFEGIDLYAEPRDRCHEFQAEYLESNPEVVKEVDSVSQPPSESVVMISSMADEVTLLKLCLLYTSPSPRDLSTSRMPSSA